MKALEVIFVTFLSVVVMTIVILTPLGFALVICNPEPGETIFEAVYKRHLWKIIIADLFFLAPFVWSLFDEKEEDEREQDESGSVPIVWHCVIALMQFVNKALLMSLICVGAWYHELFVSYPWALVPFLAVIVYLCHRIFNDER